MHEWTVRALHLPVESDALQRMATVMDGAYRSGPFVRRVNRFAALQPDAVIVAESAGRIVGTGCGLAFPEAGFGWIGLIATLPDFARRGIGAAVTEEVARVLASLGCAPALDASAAGEAVYRRLGYVDHGPTAMMAAEWSGGGDPDPELTVSIERGIVALDRRATGADRSRLLRSALGEARAVAALDSDGAVRGFAIAEGESIGPMIAVDDDALHDVLVALQRLRWTAPPRLNVPPASRFRGVLAAHGFVPVRTLRHMRRGIETLPGERELIAAQVSLGEG